VLFGEPGIYPDGPPMVPAVGPEPDAATARAQLSETLPDVAACARALAHFDRPELGARVPAPLLRAAVACLVGTIAEPVLDLVVGGAPIGPLGVGAPASPGRVVGPAADHRPGRVVNERYRAEHPALVAPSLVHDLLWSGPGAGQYEEVVLHALVAMVHVQLVVRCPSLCHRGTELARRQSSLAITLLNSRSPGSASIALIAPDGPGTIPGGAMGMQTPDFWSIPFVAGPPRAGPAPAALADVLAGVVDGDRLGGAAARYDEALGRALSTRLGRGWLSVRDQVVAAIALGLLELGDVAGRAAAPPSEVVALLALAPAVACWPG